MKTLMNLSRNLRALAVGALLTAGVGQAQGQDCIATIDHEDRTPGESWSIPSDYMFTADGIPVFTASFTDGGGTRMGAVGIGASPHPDMGSGLVNVYQEACTYYNISALGLLVDQVRFEALSQSQVVNIGANGYAVFAGPLDGLDGVSIAPGVTLAVAARTLPDGTVIAQVVVMGNVKNLTFGGGEAALDNLCVVGHEAPDIPCHNLADHHSLAPGSSFGAGTELPGDHVFTESEIEVSVQELKTGIFGTPRFDTARVASRILPYMDGQYMRLEDIALEYSVALLGRPVRKVTFRYYEPQRFMHSEMISVGSERYSGQIADLPADAFTGVAATATSVVSSPDAWGSVILDGDVRNLRIGGGLLAIDEVCFLFADGTSAVVPDGRLPGLEMSIFPNPCNPRADIRFNLRRSGRVRIDIHDVSGRLVTSLLDRDLGAENHVVTWDGRDGRGRAAATGLYFVKIATAEGIETRKLALIK